MSTFKATAFRSTSGTQYGDQLWLNSLGTIATPSTYGETTSLKAAYLNSGEAAVPAVFGSLSWRAPLEDFPSQCAIKLFEGEDMLTAMTIEPFKTTIHNDVEAMTGFTVNGSMFLPSVENINSGMILSVDTSTGEVGYIPFTGADIVNDTQDIFTVTEDLRLPNVPTFRTSYALYIEPMTGSVKKAETPYAVTTVDDVVDLVAFSANVATANLFSTNLTVDGNVYLPSIPYASSAAATALTLDPLTGQVVVASIAEADTTPLLTVTEDLRLPNLPSLRTSYDLHVDPLTGSVSKAETPYTVTTVDGVVDLVAFSSNVLAGNLVQGNVLQVGSGSDDVWRFRPDPASGSLAIEKLEGGLWVAKTTIASS